MPAYFSKGELVNYITSGGFRQSRIVSMAQIDDRIYYRLENGDHVKDSSLGFVKSYGHEELLRLFGEVYGGKTIQ